ncbi:MAG: SLC13 family permease [Clostridia bacterium]|nr:SLC13 family permease [Clostridia bacterium]
MKIANFLKQNIVLTVAWILAAVSVFFVPPDKEYLSYFDVKTLLCLFSIMLVLGGYKNINIFTISARVLIKKLKNARFLVMNMVLLTFFSSIFIANDMALLTFLPLTILVFKQCGKEEYIATTVIMQNIAANLGGMIMPFGNPQSLYLHSFYAIPLSDFVLTMLLPFAVSLLLIVLFGFTVKKHPVELVIDVHYDLNTRKTVVYALLFAVSILSVFNIIPYIIAGGIVIAAMLLLDRKAFRKVDYGLLFTFAAFFVFASNMSRLPAIARLVTLLMEKSTLLTGVLFCQFFSNVPSAIFLSQFTANYRELLLAVNIGGTGTLVASLASLISFRIYSAMYPKKALVYLGKFFALNFAFLLMLIFVSFINIRYIL